MSSTDIKMRGRRIYAYRDCDANVKTAIGNFFTCWSKVVIDDAAPLSDEELEEHVDQLVFDAWDTDMKPDAPSFEAPAVAATWVQIGYFSRDLPDPDWARPLWEAEVDHDIFEATREHPKIHLPALPGRALGQPAFARARSAWQEQVLGIPFEFYDKHGKWAPVACIDFRTPDNTPSEIMLATACNRADNAWANACDNWNANLCIYLCRLKLFNRCHVRAWKRNDQLSEAHFRKAFVARVSELMPTTLERIQKISLLTHTRRINNRRGRAVFERRATDQSANVKSESP